MHHCPSSESIFFQAFSLFNQGTYTLDGTTYLIHAGTEYRSLDFHRIGIALHDGVYSQRVSIGQLERIHFKLSNIKYGIVPSCFTNQTNRFPICIASKSACIFYKSTYTFIAFHLIIHRAFHFTGNIDKTIIGTY